MTKVVLLIIAAFASIAWAIYITRDTQDND